VGPLVGDMRGAHRQRRAGASFCEHVDRTLARFPYSYPGS
jgi:hypothetical protein